MSTTHETTLEQLFEGVWGGANPDCADELVHAEYVIHDRELAETYRGPELYRQLAAATREIVPDASFSIDDVLADGDRVALRWTMTGTHEGPAYGLEATGERVTMEGIEIDRFEDGLLAETWARSDTLGLLEQLGGFETVGAEIEG